MKKFVSKQKNCLCTLLSLIFIVEILLTINNKFIQSIGIVLVPFIIMFGYLLIKNEGKKKEE